MILVESTCELVDGWWHFESHVQDSLLTLNTDVLGPLYEAREVALGLDISANTEIASTLLEEGVLLFL